MKILVQSALAFAVTPTLGYGGMERLAWDFADELQAQGHDVTLWAAADTVPPGGVKLMHAGFNATPDLSKERDATFSTLPAIKKEKFDVVHDLTHQHWYARNEGLDVPTISVFWHDPYIAKFPQPYHNIIALSDWAKVRFEKIYQQDAIVQETIIVNPYKYNYQPEIKRENWFVFVGKMSHEKGALDAIRICKASGVGLKIIGGKGLACDPDDYQKEVMRQATGNIEYLGNVNDTIKIECLKKAKALIYPVNQMEITSYKNMEALMCGCPVLVYDRGAMSHTVEHGVTGLLIKDEQDFIGQLTDLTEVENLSAEDCRRISVERWGKQNVVADNVKLYKKVANGLRWF